MLESRPRLPSILAEMDHQRDRIMASRALPAPHILRQLLDYNRETGAFIWKVRHESCHADRVFNIRFSGREALTSTGANGYRRGSIKCADVYAHRVAWAMETGKWPDGQIDHIDGNRTNNTFSNLREVDRAENAKNSGLRATKLSGLPKGVFRNPSGSANPYKAQIVVSGRAIHLGTFKTPSLAQKAYADATVRFGFSMRHACID